MAAILKRKSLCNQQTRYYFKQMASFTNQCNSTNSTAWVNAKIIVRCLWVYTTQDSIGLYLKTSRRRHANYFPKNYCFI